MQISTELFHNPSPLDTLSHLVYNVNRRIVGNAETGLMFAKQSLIGASTDATRTVVVPQTALSEMIQQRSPRRPVVSE